MDQIRALRVFVRIVDSGSFAAASRAMDLALAVVTRTMGELEEHLGARLLNRSTRRLALTSIGESYLERARHPEGHRRRDRSGAPGPRRAARAAARGGAAVLRGAPARASAGAFPCRTSGRHGGDHHRMAAHGARQRTRPDDHRRARTAARRLRGSPAGAPKCSTAQRRRTWRCTGGRASRRIWRRTA